MNSLLGVAQRLESRQTIGLKRELVMMMIHTHTCIYISCINSYQVPIHWIKFVGVCLYCTFHEDPRSRMLPNGVDFRFHSVGDGKYIGARTVVNVWTLRLLVRLWPTHSIRVNFFSRPYIRHYNKLALVQFSLHFLWSRLRPSIDPQPFTWAAIVPYCGDVFHNIQWNVTTKIESSEDSIFCTESPDACIVVSFV